MQYGPETDSRLQVIDEGRRRPSERGEHPNLFQRLFEHRGRSMAHDDLHAEGSLKRMDYPRDWHQVIPEISRPGAPVGPLKLSEFHPPHEKDVKLCYWNRAYGNVKEDAQTAQSFQRVLNQEPHKLSQAELNSLRHLLADGYYANQDPYQVLRAETRSVHGRNVLMIESEYKSHDPEKPNNRSLSMFVSSDGTGRYTEQIYFVAPESKYQNYAGKAAQSMDSVKWRRPERVPF